jgi:hypothetical protein
MMVEKVEKKLNGKSAENIERRVVEALTDAEMSSSDLGNLLAELNFAADAAAKLAATKSRSAYRASSCGPTRRCGLVCKTSSAPRRVRRTMQINWYLRGMRCNFSAHHRQRRRWRTLGRRWPRDICVLPPITGRQGAIML